MRKILFFCWLTSFYASLACAMTIQVDGVFVNIVENSENASVVADPQGNKYKGDIVIPKGFVYNTHNYFVTKIAENAFSNCTELTSIHIPQYVNIIATTAFSRCVNLKTVYIDASSILSRGDYGPFVNLSTLFGTQVESYFLGDQIEQISRYAFYGCTNLRRIVASDNLLLISQDAILNCPNLEAENHICYIGRHAITVDDQLVDSIIVKNGTWYLHSGVFGNCPNLTYVSLPSSLQMIGNATFRFCSQLESIVIPDSVLQIGPFAFEGCKQLQSVSIGSGVRDIGEYAFNGCSNIKNLVVPDQVLTIGYQACYGVCNVVYHGSAIGSPWGAKTRNAVYDSPFFFSDESKTHLLACTQDCPTIVQIPSTVRVIGKKAFEKCSHITSVSMPEGLSVIDTSAFTSCLSLSEITFPSTLTSINTLAFNCCFFKTLVIPNSVTFLGSGAFEGCDYLESVQLGTSVTEIPYHIFTCCSRLKDVIILGPVERIREYAFDGCIRLKQITLPASLTAIDNYAFYQSVSLKSVYLLSITPPTIGPYSWQFVPKTCVYYIPKGTLDAYVTVWGADYHFEEMNTTDMPQSFVPSSHKILKNGQVLIPSIKGNYNVNGYLLQ